MQCLICDKSCGWSFRAETEVRRAESRCDVFWLGAASPSPHQSVGLRSAVNCLSGVLAEFVAVADVAHIH